MGGATAAIAKAREDYAKSDYRWVADVMSQVVFAEPDNAEARALAADAYEQLGDQSESATWRIAYLLGARELRSGTPEAKSRAPVSPDLVNARTVPLFFDYLGVRLNGPKAEGVRMVINWTITNGAEKYAPNLENSALTYVEDHHAEDATATVSLERPVLSELLMERVSIDEAIAKGLLVVDGDTSSVGQLFSLLDEFTFLFPIIEPRRDS